MTDGRKTPSVVASPSKAKIWLDMHVFDRLTTERGWDTDVERARGLGIDPSILSRLRSRQISLGADLVYRLPILLDVDPKILFIREEQ
jgi:hypothetical protein